jgi:hypothetical protein
VDSVVGLGAGSDDLISGLGKG